MLQSVYRTARSLGLSGGLMLSAVSPVLAVDAEGFLSAFVKLMEFSGYQIGIKDIETSGDQIIVNRARVGLGGLSNLEDLDLPFDASTRFDIPGPVTFSNVREDNDGNFQASRMDLTPMVFEFDDVAISIAEISYRDIFVSSADPVSIIDVILLAGQTVFGPLDMTVNDVPAIHFDQMVATNTYRPGPSSAVENMSSTFTLPLAQVFLENAPRDMDPEVEAVFGNETLEFSANASSTWDIETGRLTYHAVRLLAYDLGELTFTFDMSGFTPEVVNQLMELSRNTDAQDTDAQEQLMELGMGLLARSFFYSLTIRYEDYGAMERWFTYFEENEDATRVALAEEILRETSEFFDKADSEELQQMFATAVTEFIADPKDFEITITPETPLPAISFLGLAAAPSILVDALGISILANQIDEDNPDA